MMKFIMVQMNLDWILLEVYFPVLMFYYQYNEKNQ